MVSAVVEGKRHYLQGKLRRLREVYIDGHLGQGEYHRRRAELEAELDALREPEAPEVEEAGATLESLNDAWEGASVRLRAEMLRAIFESVVIDVAARRMVCVKPYPPFVPLFRMDGLTEKEGVFPCQRRRPRSWTHGLSGFCSLSWRPGGRDEGPFSPSPGPERLNIALIADSA